MTLFVATLFLPQTLGFERGDAQNLVEAEPNTNDEKQRPSTIPNLLNSFASRTPSAVQTRHDSPLVSPTPPGSPPRPSLFSRPSTSQLSQDDSINLLSARLHKVNLDSAAAKSKRNLTIPQSRASSPPEAALVAPRPANLRTTSMTRPAEYIPGEAKRKASESRKDLRALINPAYSDALYQVLDQHKGNGGLRNAVGAAYRAGLIVKPLWVGLLGIPGDEIATATKSRIRKHFESSDQINSLVVDVSDDTARLGYDHYCKYDFRELGPKFTKQGMLVSLLWRFMLIWAQQENVMASVPLSDSRFAKNEDLRRAVLSCIPPYYEQLNQAFADRISEKYRRGDTIWINDYHLLLAPAMIRKRHPNAMIGLFIHIAFPSSEVFRCLEKRRQLLNGMLASNVIGFQTEDHCQHFKQTCSRLLYVETTDCGIQLEHSFVKIIALPIGIDPKQLAQDIDSLGVKDLSRSLAARLQESGMKVIVGRDKLDHVKGVLHKLRAFGEFLRTNPDQQGRVVLMQFGSPAKKDPILTAEIRDLATKINSRYSIIALDYQPIVLKADVSYQEYLALITMADVFIVSSVREGMNLTCHEYIFCQQARKNPLILSEFVGSAHLFEHDALMVNPFDYKQTAEAIRRALVMSDEEKKRRWDALNRIVHEEDGGRWAKQFITQIQRDYIDQMKKRSVDLPRLNAEALLDRYRSATRRLIFIDYEGTLLQWEANVNVIAGTGKIVDLLNNLTADPNNTVYVTSERTASELERTFRRVQRIGLIAENGGYARSADTGLWSNLTPADALLWKDNVREIVQYYKERTPGTFIEEQNNRIVFHYASAENLETAQRQVSEMNNHIMDSSARQDVHALPLKNVLVVEPISITKATAADCIIQALGTIDDIDFVASFGNDRADEELYDWVNCFPARTKRPADIFALTVNVGIRNTEAKMFVNSTFGVHAALSTWTKQRS